MHFQYLLQHLSPTSQPTTNYHHHPSSVLGWWLLRPSPHPLPQPPVALVFLDFGFYKPALFLCLFLWMGISNNRTLLFDFDFPASGLLPGFAFSMWAARHLYTLPKLDTSTHYSIGQTLASLSAGRIPMTSPHSRASSSFL